MANERIEAAEAYVQALRTGEGSATARAGRYLAKDVVLTFGKDEFKGYDDVIRRITGIWAFTPVYNQGAWSAAKEQDGKVTIGAQLTPLGAAPASISLTFGFNSENKINRVEHVNTPQPPATPTDVFPDFVRGYINSALANNTPMVLAYVNDDGQPVQTLRGSTQVFSEHQLCIWVRNGGGNTVKTITKNPRVSMLYRDSKGRATIIVQGRGHFESDPKVRERVYGIAPEVEQLHDPGMKNGAALIIDVTSVAGSTPRGAVRMQRG